MSIHQFLIEETKQAAADVLSNYSQFVMAGFPGNGTVSPDSAQGESSSFGGTRGGDRTDDSQVLLLPGTTVIKLIHFGLGTS
ncbi:hypothetical protein MKW94_014168 [Papaver nudicaule]|uniref:Uncharacterized protein n=1 Tax=Papaver nudicaule TaxID=74823 RepID=A0AA41RM25_PAPNU|nr:hypothetical protein [Papaver nudicaule]